LHVDRRAAAHGGRGSRLLSLRRDDAAAARLRRRLLVRVHQLKLAVGGHRILVLLAEEMLVEKDIEVRRKRVRVLALEKCNRPRVLLTAEDQLGFLLPLRGGAPRGQRHSEEDRHDGHADEQRRHRVATVARPSAR